MLNEPYDPDFLDTYHPGQANLTSSDVPRPHPQDPLYNGIPYDYDDDEGLASINSNIMRNHKMGIQQIARTNRTTMPIVTGNVAPSVANSQQQQPTRTSISGRSLDSIASGGGGATSIGRHHQSTSHGKGTSSTLNSNKNANESRSRSKSKKRGHGTHAGGAHHGKSSSSSYNKKEKYKSPAKRGFLRVKMSKVRISLLNSGLVSMKLLEKDIQAFLPKERMNSTEFERHVKLMRKYEVIASSEYRYVCKYETYACRHATKESNLIKNNYKKCIPYDYNRVVLKTLPNVPDSDYVNASHLDSYLKPNAYIAAQGPNEYTIDDFWRMIWEQKTFVVVMLTKVFDFIRVMCNQYWPVELNKPEKYGQLEVTLLYEEPLADFVIRTIRLCKIPAVKPDEEVKRNKLDGQNSDEDYDGYNIEDDGASDEEDDLDDEEDNVGTDVKAKGNHYNHKQNIQQQSDRNGDEQNRTPTLNENQSKVTSLLRQPKFTESTVKISRKNDRRPTLKILSENEQGSANTSIYQPSTGSSHNEPQSSSNLSNSGPFFSQYLRPEDNIDQYQRSISQPSTPTFLTPMTPMTPLTPATPGTPLSLGSGIERDSATRKPVKKKKRERKRNIRPVRTQFQAPDEAALDDDESNEAAFLNHADGSGVHNERVIYQFHYHSWASHTCPSIDSLLHFRRRVRICMEEMSKSGRTGPTIVHCNDGCGRTGTYLCIDANLELAEEDGVYDVYNYTMKMRQSRKNLIENLKQYKFVYDTIEEAMICGKTWFPVSELSQRLKHKSTRNPLTQKNEYQREYEKITSRMTAKFSIGDCAGGHRVDNREKNRDVSTVPPDNFRPYLTSFQSNDNTDYINAVFVDGYTRSKEYIVTEWPMQKTIPDFWSLIYDHDCNSVILLANPIDSSTYPSFLLGEKERQRKFGSVFTADKVQSNEYQNIKSWIYTINKKIMALSEVMAGMKPEPKTTQIFQITCWPQGHRVPTSTNTLVELMNMVERWRQRTTYGPVCVVSLDGKSRAGVYCAANVAIEQVVQHGEVDVFQAVKTVRRHRPQLIENMTEYKYCYDLILHYVLHYLNQNTT